MTGTATVILTPTATPEPTLTITTGASPTYTPTVTPTSYITPTPTSTPTIQSVDCCWQTPINCGLPLNSNAKDWHPTLASDNTTLFFASARLGGKGKSDIWVSSRITPGGPTDWASPINLGNNINTSQLEAAPSISFDMRELFFEAYSISNTSLDLFYTSWNDITSNWNPRSPLPANINYSNIDERHPFLTRDGTELYYDTRRSHPAAPGDYDIWKTVRIRGKWSDPVPITTNVNTIDYEAAPIIYYYPGGRQLYFESTHYGPTNEMFLSEWNGTDWDPPKRMCKDFINTLHPTFKSDGSELLFHSILGGYGDYDIFLSVCKASPTPTGVWYSPTPTVTSTVKPVVPAANQLPLGFLCFLLGMTLAAMGRKFIKS